MNKTRTALVSLLLSLGSQPLLAELPSDHQIMGNSSPLAQLLTVVLGLVFVGVFFLAIARKFREDGIDEQDENTKRFGCAGTFLIILIAVVLISVFANGFTGIHMESWFVEFINDVIQGLRAII